jgi:hypothetical protein
MQNIINQILSHPNLFHSSTTITPEHLKNNYLRNHLQSINCEQNLTELLNKLNNL